MHKFAGVPLARKVEKQTENDQHISDAVASLERLRDYRVSWGGEKKEKATDAIEFLTPRATEYICGFSIQFAEWKNVNLHKFSDKY